ncbi:hypothetical protein B0J18DRAFT_437066 [Chaetomium sp. MPI-SDFR-AT-0129]|nr:hypothetical protein B0J18DRAFT_437066 [Chaetomium sp. MPI-SDFR-AT-0129]
MSGFAPSSHSARNLLLMPDVISPGVKQFLFPFSSTDISTQPSSSPTSPAPYSLENSSQLLCLTPRRSANAAPRLLTSSTFLSTNVPHVLSIPCTSSSADGTKYSTTTGVATALMLEPASLSSHAQSALHPNSDHAPSNPPFSFLGRSTSAVTFRANTSKAASTASARRTLSAAGLSKALTTSYSLATSFAARRVAAALNLVAFLSPAHQLWKSKFVHCCAKADVSSGFSPSWCIRNSWGTSSETATMDSAVALARVWRLRSRPVMLAATGRSLGKEGSATPKRRSAVWLWKGDCLMRGALPGLGPRASVAVGDSDSSSCCLWCWKRLVLYAAE